MQSIIKSSQSGLNPEMSSIVYGTIQLPTVFLSAFLVDKIGRKPILIISSLGCAVSLIAEGIYFYLQEYLQVDTSSLGWLPTTGLVTFALMNNFGICTLPYVLLGELFATNIKGVASSLSICYGGTLAFVVSKFFKPLSNSWGMYTMFWIFGGCCVLGSLYVYYLIPETKGKTFNDIQDKLKKKKSSNKEESKEANNVQLMVEGDAV